ncbi:MAG: SpaA isopeptide-forming pilin-related protein, partial [Oscillospiraceae bacterium]
FVSNTGVASARAGLTDTEIDADGDLDEFVNKKTDSYTFRKVGDELAPLNGVTFKVLEKMADGTTKEFANVTSNAEGKVTVEGLSTGKTYVVRETGVGENADYLVSNKTFELTVNADGSVDSTIREADHFFFNKKVPSAEGEITEQKKLDVEHFYFDPNVSKEDEYVDPKADKYEDNKVYFEGFVRTLNNKDPFNQYSYSIMGNPELNVTVLPVLNPVIPNEEQLNYIKLAEDGTVVQAFTDDELVMKELGLTDLTSLTPTAEAQTAFDAAQATYDAAVKALEDAQKTITDKAATIAALDAELAQLNEDLLAAQIALNTAENEDPQVEEKVLAAMSAVANAETSIITKNMEIVDANAIVTATEEEIATLTAAVTAAQTALTDATTALEDSKKQSAEYLDALAFAKAKIEKQIEAYNALCAQVVTRNEELNAGLAAATTVQTDENGKSYFNYQSGYSYTVVYKYTRPTPETPVDPPIPPVDPPIPPVNPPVTPPVTPPVIPPVIIPDDPTPLGPVPRRKIYDDPTPTGFLPKRSGLYLIADDETPLGALPHTSGNRAAAAGAMGVITLLAGSLLGLFGKKKK